MFKCLLVCFSLFGVIFLFDIQIVPFLARGSHFKLIFAIVLIRFFIMENFICRSKIVQCCLMWPSPVSAVSSSWPNLFHMHPHTLHPPLHTPRLFKKFWTPCHFICKYFRMYLYKRKFFKIFRIIIIQKTQLLNIGVIYYYIIP